MDLIYEVFSADLPRQGPGDDESTKRAWSYLTDLPSNPCILDVGCGTGKQTLALARLTNGKIIALDNHQPFLDKLDKNVEEMDFTQKVTVFNQSMLDMSFKKNSFNVIWSEGAAYIYGFEKALKDWQVFLKEGGYIVFSELCWFKKDVPKEIQDYFIGIYPPMKTIEENISIINSKGLDLIVHFNLPESSWWDNLYAPLEKRIKILRKEYQKNEETLGLLDTFGEEVEMFRKYSKYYGYTFFIMKKA